MKKLMFVCLCVGLLASCDVKNSDEYKTIQAQNDSLMKATAQSNAELTESMDIINTIEENFNQIKEAEKYLAVESKSKGDMNASTKTQITDNFNMINDILLKNKKEIENLNSKLKSSKGQLTGLTATIERLNKELEERAASIVSLQEALTERDKEIAALNTNIGRLSSHVNNLSDQVMDQASTIKEQDRALNTAYYVFGTSKELKEAKIVSGGFLSSSKVMKESIDKSSFVAVDIRDTKAIPVYAKKAKVLSEHPKASYSLDKDANGQIVINILDYKKFWSVTPYLVVQVN
ncbi:Cbp1 family collagen-binding glycoprotein adhesin [Viscerimonas tarda]